MQWFQLRSRFIELRSNNLSRRWIKIIQLVDWETYFICIRLSYVRFRMDTRFPVSFLLLSPLSSPSQNTLIANLNRRIYVDECLHTLLDFRFNQPFFQRGDFPQIIFNGSGLAPLPNPWINGSYSTPFDQGLFPLIHHQKRFNNIGCNRILPYFERGCGFYKWMVPRWSR